MLAIGAASQGKICGVINKECSLKRELDTDLKKRMFWCVSLVKTNRQISRQQLAFSMEKFP
jgi:hypothetical protein